LKLLKLIFLAYALGVCPSFADDLPVTFYGNFSHRLQSPDSLDFAKVKSIIQSNKIRSLSGLLRFFRGSEKYADYARYFALMYRSGSRQRLHVDKKHPRMLIHKDRVMMGLTGKRKGEARRTFNQLEWVELPVGGIHFVPYVIDFNDGTVTFSDDKPELVGSCRGCHGDPFVPNWRAYALWPGAYGSHDDHLALTPDEKDDLEDFLDGAETRRRYGELVYDQFEIADDDRLRFRPNFHLTLHAYALNHVRILNLIQKKTPFASYKYAYLAALNDCSDIPAFLPDSVQAEHARQIEPGGVESLLKDTLDVIVDEFKQRLSLVGFAESSVGLGKLPAAYTNFSKGSADTVGKLRYLIEGQGLSMERWSLSYDEPDGRSFAFEDGAGTGNGARPGGLVRFLESYLTKEIHEERRHRPYRAGDECSRLREESLAAFAAR